MNFVDFESILVPENNRKQNPDEFYTNKHQNHIKYSFGYKLVSADDQFSKLLKPFLGQNVVHKFITNMIQENKYCTRVIKKKINEEPVMTKGDENFESSTKCWICDNNFLKGDVKVRDYCYVTGKYKAAAHTDCNITVSLNYKIVFSKTMRHILLSKNLENLNLK